MKKINTTKETRLSFKDMSSIIGGANSYWECTTDTWDCSNINNIRKDVQTDITSDDGHLISSVVKPVPYI